tara:strand:+ start:277 stop:498 length:222 start_codon:yes stop_codon:yes gene_type:complete
MTITEYESLDSQPSDPYFNQYPDLDTPSFYSEWDYEDIWDLFNQDFQGPLLPPLQGPSVPLIQGPLTPDELWF